MAKSTMYLSGLLVGGAIAGTTVLLSSPETKEKLQDELSIYKETMRKNYQDIKHDLQELIYIGEELKEKAVAFLNEQLPDVMDRIRLFIDELKPQLIELKEYILELQQQVLELSQQLRDWTRKTIAD